MTFPKQIQNLIEAFERLPGIGPKSAARLAFYLLHVPETEINRLGMSVIDLKKGIVLCSACRNISSLETCEICSDSKRDKGTICVVESPLDVFSLEKMGKYSGLYHVLHGVINPLNNIGPEELYIADFIKRVKERDLSIPLEIILALNPTMEGEATAMYLNKQLRELKISNFKVGEAQLHRSMKISRLGVGMPIGGDMQYADSITLSRALEGRRIFD